MTETPKDETSQPPESPKREFIETVERKAQRKSLARKAKDRSLWSWLGMMGLVGWSVAIPTLIGVYVGIQLDKAWPDGLSWTLTCLVLGIAAGCLQAWYWVRKESRDE